MQHPDLLNASPSPSTPFLMSGQRDPGFRPSTAAATAELPPRAALPMWARMQAALPSKASSGLAREVLAAAAVPLVHCAPPLSTQQHSWQQQQQTVAPSAGHRLCPPANLPACPSSGAACLHRWQSETRVYSQLKLGGEGRTLQGSCRGGSWRLPFCSATGAAPWPLRGRRPCDSACLPFSRPTACRRSHCC